MKFKLILFTVFASMLFGANSEAQTTTIILVRHAEKRFDEAGDPDLTSEGKIRAQELARVLQFTSVDAIYSTPFKRTQQTVEPLAEDNDLEIQTYNPFKLNQIIELIDKHKGQTLVFSGHSNTTPVILNKLTGKDTYRQLDDGDYDNLYIVSYQGKENATVTVLEYGQDTMP